MMVSLRGLLAISSGALMFLILILFLCYFLPLSKPYSLFHKHDDILTEANNLNTGRLRKAKAYFNNLNKKESMDFFNKPLQTKLDLVVMVVSVQRGSHKAKDSGYFLQTVGTMDKILKQDKNFPLNKLVVCNVDKNPEEYADARFVSDYIPTVLRFGNWTWYTPTSNQQRLNLYKKTSHISLFEKETVDYMFCLETVYNMNSTYVMLIEDDAYPRHDLLEVVKYSMNRTNRQRNFVYIKLFYPQKWQGFAWEETRIIELLSIGCVGGGLFVLSVYVFSRRYPSTKVQYLYFISGFTYFIVLALIIARPNMMELRRFSKYLYIVRTSPGCCTPAMLYSTSEIPALLDFLSGPDIDKEKDHTDLAIYKYITKMKKHAYQIEPNLFYHIGMFSSLNKGDKNPEEFIIQA